MRLRTLWVLAVVAASGCEQRGAPKSSDPAKATPAPPLDLSSKKSQGAALTVPRTLEAYFMSKSGPTWSVAMAGMGALSWRFDPDSGGEKPTRFETVSIPVERWKAFRAALDSAGAFDLEPKYKGEVKDGADWRLSVDFGDRSVTARGHDGGAPSGRTWDDIAQALNALTGNKLR